MTLEQAIQLVVTRFPFPDYIKFEKESQSLSHIARTVIRYIPPGSKILDFGCGPCDKTAVLQICGFRCSGYDDLQDHWHKLPGNRESIISFAKECGVDLRTATDGILPFEPNTFDMVMLHGVLEHLHESPRELLNDLLEVTK